MAAGRRTSLASLAGAKVDDVPGRSDPLLLSLPLNRLVPTRFNPRRRFGTDDELREFGQKLAKEQLQPAVVVSRTAYLKLWPEEAEHVGDAAYVIANGERRYRASRLAGRPVLEVVHKEDVASSRAAFLDAVQSENNDRQDLDPIERALAIDIMVRELGGADQVAVYYGKTKGWVSQQRKLLKLTPELQDLVSSGELPVRVGRDIAGLPPEVQSTAWEEEVAKRKAAKEAADRWKTAGAPDPEPAPTPAPAARFTAVNQQPPPPPPAAVDGTGQPERFTAVNRPNHSEGEEGTAPAPLPAPAPVTVPEQHHVPEQRPVAAPAALEPIPEGRKLPYDDGVNVARHLILKMPTDAFVAMLRVMNQHAAEHGLNVAPEHAS
ncbi:ParB/RepB/Spo0J family partition protein [Streptomyces griseorubiginosus]|uniref:ParB/RepB/Spo0J family partition protein n=1 Tax=Streptomyces griseorubiginosus TaxID=67304 RepID=UPI003331D55B